VADSTISNEDISATLPEGAVVSIDTGSNGENQLTVGKKVDGMEVAASSGSTDISGKQVNNSTISAAAEAGETSQITIQTTGFVGSTIKNEGKGSIVVTHSTGSFKKSTIDAGANKKRDDVVKFGNEAKIIKGEVIMGKGNDTVRFKKDAVFKKKTTIDLGKGGSDKVFIKSTKGVEGGKLTITSFSKKDELTIGKTTFDYKDIQGGVDLPGNIKVDLA